MLHTNRFISIITLLLVLSTNILPSFLSGWGTTFAYTESTKNTFIEYQKQLISIKEDIEADFRKNGTASSSMLQNAKNIVQGAYDRLPDTLDFSTENATAKKWTDLAIDLALKNPTSQTYVSNAVSAVEKFSNEAKILKIAWSINANPVSGNAPLSVSFLAASVKDPSGVNPDPNNYIWWVRDNGGYRREIGRWPTLNYSFNKEWSYQVFLDVISGSRNSKWYTDVLPLSTSQDIQVLPRLGEIVLLINGVNVSTLSSLKISPALGKIGIIFDATASRAISNGTIKKTKWDFGNGNTIEYKWSPVIERQLYVNQGAYQASLELETNEGTTFKKDFQLIIIDPTATISTDKTNGFVGDDFQMKAMTYFTNTRNVEYTWTVQWSNMNDLHPVVQIGQNFSYKFPNVWDYIVTLISKSPNGTEDRDSKTITIDSHEPIVNVENPKNISPEKPNIFIFDASRSIDPDTNSTKDLTYKWTIDGNDVALDNQEKDGAIGKYMFNEKWTHTFAVTVINSHGKSKTVEKSLDVISTLSVNVNIVPRAAPIGTLVSFQAISPRAAFYEWNPGDGTPTINGQMSSIDHVYKKTGIYSATLNVKSADGTESNAIERKVYVTDANNPFALIEVSNASNSVLEDSTACGAYGWAFLVNRSEWTTIDGSNSVNIDGSNWSLTYTWKYLDRVKTGPTLSEKFTELGCFPVELTVKSMQNGASHISKRYIQIKNIPPKLTSISTKIDQNKKDSQKILINVTADGARDEDGVITSYIWYYKTESDAEPQNIKITQSPTTTFIVPNITEKYTFWVILEDNDGAKVRSEDLIKDQSPLLVSNDNGNINMPLIGLSVPKTQVLAGETVNFVVTAKTIVGTDITSKSEYQWDFDGDGKIDRKTTEARTSFVYPNSWTFAAKVKVTYNGTSNTKYQNIVVKNELKAQAHGYKSGDTIYLINTSSGIYDSAFWQVGDIQSDSLYGIAVPASGIFGSWGSKKSLTVNAWGNETSTIDISPANIQEIESTLSWGIFVQSFPQISNGEIHVHTRGDKILLWMFGNTWATQYTIDINTKIDSDTNGTPDDDIDNKDFPSYKDGSIYSFNTSDMKLHRQTLRLAVMKNTTVLWSQQIDIIADFISDITPETTNLLTDSGSESFSQKEKENLEKFQAKIRTIQSDERIILTQDYNSLIESWDDTLERTKKLIDIQEEINGSAWVTDTDKKELSGIIDSILVGDANATDEVTVATRVIESLVSSTNPNHNTIIEKLESIKSHPNNLKENKTLASEILALIKDDTSLEDKYKLLIRSQLQIILNGWQESISSSLVVSGEQPRGTSWFWWFITGTVKVFGIIIIVIIIIILIGFILYRFSRKNNDIGFQDFLIDSIFHTRNSKWPSSSGDWIFAKKEIFAKVDPLATAIQESIPSIVIPSSSPVEDPMTKFSQMSVQEVTKDEILVKTPIQEEVASIPDWLKPKNDTIVQASPPIFPEWAMSDVTTPTSILDDSVLWSENNLLPSETFPIPEASLPPEFIADTEAPLPWDIHSNKEEDPNLPDWLKGMSADDDIIPLNALSDTNNTEWVVDMNISPESPEEIPATPRTQEELIPIEWTSLKTPETVTNSDALPDWLIDSVTPTSQQETVKNSEKFSSEKSQKWEKTPKSKKPKKEILTGSKKDLSHQPQDTVSQSTDLPDWLK